MTLSSAIVVADIDALVTDGLARILEGHGHTVRIAMAAHSAVHAEVRAFRANICVVDLWLRDGHDPVHIERLTTDYPGLKVIIRTADSSAGALQAALTAGAVGYLHKSRSAWLLPAMIDRIADGEIAVEASFTQDGLTDEGAAADLRRLLGYLTQRERECLDLIAQGRGTDAIAAQIGVSTATVRTHIQSMFNKLGVHSRLEAAALMGRHLPPAVAYPVPAQDRRGAADGAPAPKAPG